MRRAALLVLVLTALSAAAQEPGARAWQQRLAVAMPIVLPMVTLEPVNPFAEAVEVPPTLLQATLPERLDVTGHAVVAAYVDGDGQCREAIVLEQPFPDLVTPLVAELKDTRFEPARVGAQARPAWVVLEVGFASEVRTATVIDQVLQMPDPTAPPAPASPLASAPPGRLAELPAADPATLTTLPSPRRVRVRVPRHQADVGVRLMAHVTADGRCDRFVPLELDGGLVPWVATYLASWRLDPARSGGAPVASWVVWTARFGLDLATLKSDEVKVLRDRLFSPAGSSGAAPTPSAGPPT
jgi:hypothetical protein